MGFTAHLTRSKDSFCPFNRCIYALLRAKYGLDGLKVGWFYMAPRTFDRAILTTFTGFGETF